MSSVSSVAGDTPFPFIPGEASDNRIFGDEGAAIDPGPCARKSSPEAMARVQHMADRPIIPHCCVNLLWPAMPGEPEDWQVGVPVEKEHGVLFSREISSPRHAIHAHCPETLYAEYRPIPHFLPVQQEGEALNSNSLVHRGFRVERGQESG